MFNRYIRWFESGEEAEWRSEDDEPLYDGRECCAT
jgi:hypothetical protein